MTPETTAKLLKKARFANYNAIRVWGGGYYPSDWFYDLCDEMGLMVWQDFMFACAVYELTPAFEANIRQEFIENVKRIRHHASLGLWCGNNEMEQFVFEKNSWLTKASEVRDYFLMFERIIPEIVHTYDPQAFYWPPALPPAAAWTSQTIRTEGMCITGRYGTATGRFPSTGNISSVMPRSLASRRSRP